MPSTLRQRRGFLAYEPSCEQFSGTPMLDILRGESDWSLKHYAQTVESEVFWLPSMRLTDAVLQGRNYAEEALGCTPFEYFGTAAGLAISRTESLHRPYVLIEATPA